MKMRRHGFDAHTPQEYLDHRYPFSSYLLQVIAVRDEDKGNYKVRPRTLPRRGVTWTLRRPPPNDPDKAHPAHSAISIAQPTGTPALKWTRQPPTPSGTYPTSTQGPPVTRTAPDQGRGTTARKGPKKGLNPADRDPYTQYRQKRTRY